MFLRFPEKPNNLKNQSKYSLKYVHYYYSAEPEVTWWYSLLLD